MKRAAFLVAVVCVCGLLSSCSKKEKRLKTYPVVGQVIVDGKPAAELAVTCTAVAGMNQDFPTRSSAFTDEEGRFEISTYEKGDGMPPGDYILTFVWGQRNLITAQYGGPDKLNGRYDNPETSGLKVTVQEGTRTDLGEIKLTTQ